MVGRNFLGYLGAAGVLVGLAASGYSGHTNKLKPIARIDADGDGLLDDFYRVPFNADYDAILVIDGRASRSPGLYPPRGRLLQQIPRDSDVAVEESGSQIIVVVKKKINLR